MTQPDVAYCGHQCSCFCNNPKLLHETGLKCICRYLHLTQGRGFVFKHKILQMMGLTLQMRPTLNGLFSPENIQGDFTL